MFGFDVLVDQQQKPHLLEVNFAPSLNTDSDLDLDVKSKVRHRRNGGGRDGCAVRKIGADFDYG